MLDRSHTLIVSTVALAYTALAQAAFATVGRPTVAGLAADTARWLIVLVALVIGSALAARVARERTTDWARPTVLVSMAAAVGGAVGHSLLWTVQVRAGAACNQCSPVTLLVVLAVAGSAIAAGGAPLIGALARRFGRGGAWHD
jgi:hypothetical protein